MKIKVENISINLANGKKVFFASDFHLGSPNYKESREREGLIIKWLEENEKDMQALFLLGDIFDYWFEYKHFIPKGYVRLLGKLACLCDKGIEVYFFCGNHDTWITDYFTKEIGIKTIEHNAKLNINNDIFFIGHGDGLCKGDYGYKLIKCVFRSKFSRFLFASLHPDWGHSLANCFSKKSRGISNKKRVDNRKIKTEDKYFSAFIRKILATECYNYFIFAHRHKPILVDINIGNSMKCKHLNTGDWLKHYSYGEFSNEDKLKLKFYGNSEK